MDLTSECLRAVDSSSCANLGYGQVYARTCCLNFTPTGPPTRTCQELQGTQAKRTWLCRGLAFGRESERTGDPKLEELGLTWKSTVSSQGPHLLWIPALARSKATTSSQVQSFRGEREQRPSWRGGVS